MELRPLPRSGLKVSALGLGTMTFGEQTPEKNAFAQLDLAHEAGVNLIDSAEMYPAPPRESTQGDSERLLGRWLHDRGCRDGVILATKVTARHGGMKHIRNGRLQLKFENMRSALEGSLQRLRTDRIDLYQVHWPERETSNFGSRIYPRGRPDPEETPLEETLAALVEFQRMGKIRHFGLCNETCWGTMTCLRLAEQQGWPSLASIQNPYNLLSRVYEEGLSEISDRERIPLIAYSPLAFGKLTGKYRHGQRPADARLTRYPRFNRYDKPGAEQAIQAYEKLARDLGLSLRELSLAFVLQRPFVASVLLGASSPTQLMENLRCSRLRIPQEAIERVEKIHARYPNPCP